MLASIAVAAACGVASGPAPAGVHTLFSTRVLHPDMSISPALITVDGSTIRTVQQCEHPPGGNECIDVGDRLVTPAFVNAHTHLPMAALRGIEGVAQAMSGDVVVDLYFQLEKLMSPEDVRAFARMGAYESLLSGVGLVWEHYYHGAALAQALAETGLAGVVAPTLQDLDGPGVPWLDNHLADTVTLASDSLMRERGVFAAFGPHATDTVSDELFTRIVRAADELGGLPLHLHLGQSIGEFSAVHERTGGKTPTELLKSLGVLDSRSPLLLVHAQYATEADLRLLDPSRHVLCTCPFSHALFSFPSPVPRWRRAGLDIVCGTDAAASNDCMNVQKELRLLAGFSSFTTTHSAELEAFWSSPSGGADALRAAHAMHGRRQHALGAHDELRLRSPQELLRSIWSTPGGLHPHFRAGVIEDGALANLLVWDMEHPNMWPAADELSALVMCDAAPAIDAMMVAGRWIGRSPNLRGITYQRALLDSVEYRRAREEASLRLEELLERADVKLVSGSGI